MLFHVYLDHNIIKGIRFVPLYTTSQVKLLVWPSNIQPSLMLEVILGGEAATCVITALFH